MMAMNTAIGCPAPRIWPGDVLAATAYRRDGLNGAPSDHLGFQANGAVLAEP